jgi:ABC-type oligopeptide transport system substrate-binding subunit
VYRSAPPFKINFQSNETYCGNLPWSLQLIKILVFLMAVSYAARLKKGVDYGVCGLPETFDSDRVYENKLKQLINIVKDSEYLVIHTGAG